MTHPLSAQSGYRRTPLSAEEKARGVANFAPYVAQLLVASGRFRVSADTPDQVELFQGVARRVSDLLQQPLVSYTNGREIVITFGQEESPALTLRSPGLGLPGRCWAVGGVGLDEGDDPVVQLVDPVEAAVAAGDDGDFRVRDEASAGAGLCRGDEGAARAGDQQGRHVDLA
jgi:hypothetical protein